MTYFETSALNGSNIEALFLNVALNHLNYLAGGNIPTVLDNAVDTDNIYGPKTKFDLDTQKKKNNNPKNKKCKC